MTNKRLLIIKPSSLGDIVHTLPVVHALKRHLPDSSIGWIVQKTFASLLECDPAVDTVYPVHIPSTSDPAAGSFAYYHAFKATVGTWRALRAQLRQKPYDLVLDFHASFRSGLLGRANPNGLRIGFQDAKELNTFFQNQLVAVPAQVEHALEKNLLFCDHLGYSAAPDDFFMHCKGGDTETIRLFLKQQGIGDEQKVAYANPCARWQTKFWPSEYWAALADHLFDQGIALVLAGSFHDRKFIDKISAQMQSKAYTAAGDLGLTEAVALLKRSAVYVGLDSGPMHMAAMTGTPVVALFGPTHPERVGPYRVENVVIRNENLDCLGCRKRQCNHLSCMKGVTVKEVAAAVAGFANSPGNA